jgi:hypothetical protein
MKPAERATLVKEIAKRLANEDWSLVDSTLESFSLPTYTAWNGSVLSYVLHCLRGAEETTLRELAEHVGYSSVEKSHRLIPRFWKAGMFRLFITHLATQRKVAAELQVELHSFGISSFVAHNDITPTKEWQTEIEAALSSCEALVALLHPKFHESKWTDQEIGYAMGRGIPVFTVRCGEDPYGFIGKFQAFNGNSKKAPVLAKELFDALRKGKSTSKRMGEAVIAGFTGSSSYKAAKERMAYVEELTVWDTAFTSSLEAAVKKNPQIADSFGVPERIQKLLKKWTKP